VGYAICGIWIGCVFPCLLDNVGIGYGDGDGDGFGSHSFFREKTCVFEEFVGSRIIFFVFFGKCVRVLMMLGFVCSRSGLK